ncbi:tektin C [Leptinotarsa decemlineata]|uniref:tektin C n=1 Tax=Leptinotarsa decemlineata TaxID=7539 RepID=UPI000C2534A5|nr:tektin-1 [Leptinotarsa decemlineata]
MAELRTKLADKALVAIPPPPSKFTLSEWYLNNRYRNRICLDQQKLADSIIAESDRYIDEVQEKTDLNKREVDHKLTEKLKDIEFNKGEIEKQRKEVFIEIDNLNTFMERIKDSLNALNENALKNVRKCLILREGRLGIDLCYDNVEKQLKKELQVIEGGRSLLNRTLEQSNEQVRRLRSTVYFMDRDLEDKGNVLKIDQHNSALTNTSLNLSIYHGMTPLDPANITLQEWEQFTNQNIEKAAKEINSARQLRSYVDILLKQVFEDLTAQFHSVNNAFRYRIEELKEAKTKMEIQHSEIVRQANEMTRTMTRLKKAISEKEGYMALAHTRLGNRAQRPGVELCKDLVEISLVNEVAEMRENLAILQLKLAEAQASLRYLLKTQIQLEEDINVKTNSLKIDEVDCMTLRQIMDYHNY